MSLTLLLGATTYTVTRRSVSYANGLPVYTVTETFSIYASIQPMDEEELQRAPEGVRASSGIALYVHPSSPALRTGKVGTISDVVRYRGVDYEVYRADTWDGLDPIPHLRAEAYASPTAEGVP